MKDFFYALSTTTSQQEAILESAFISGGSNGTFFMGHHAETRCGRGSIAEHSYFRGAQRRQVQVRSGGGIGSTLIHVP